MLPGLVPALSNKRFALIGFGVLFAALFAIVGVAIGIGHPSVPSGDVAVVQDAPGGTVTSADFQASLKQAAARQGITKVPPTSDPSYAALRDAAMSDALLTRWVLGEAQERGISVSQTEITTQLQQIKKQLGGEKKFQQAIAQQGFTPQDAQKRVELQLLSNEIQKQVLPTTPAVSQQQIQDFYDANSTQFQTPETRDVRQVINKDQAKVQQAKAVLDQNDSPASWKKVAAKYSTDKATNGSGGLRQGVAQGQNEPAVDQQIFSAPQGQVVGPIKGQVGYYLIEVEKVNPTKTTPLSSVTTQIKQQLSQGEQQDVATAFQTDFIDKWTSRTVCASGYVMNRCENYNAPVQTTPGAPPVISSGAVQPGHAATFPGQQPTVLPHGPQYPQPAAQQQPGVIGPGGAPQLPPGAAPQGTAPQPQTAPPSGG